MSSLGFDVMNHCEPNKNFLGMAGKDGWSSSDRFKADRENLLTELRNAITELDDLEEKSSLYSSVGKSVFIAGGMTAVVSAALLPFTLGLSSAGIVGGAIAGLSTVATSSTAKVIEHRNVCQVLDKITCLIKSDHDLFLKRPVDCPSSCPQKDHERDSDIFDLLDNLSCLISDETRERHNLKQNNSYPEKSNVLREINKNVQQCQNKDVSSGKKSSKVNNKASPLKRKFSVNIILKLRNDSDCRPLFDDKKEVSNASKGKPMGRKSSLANRRSPTEVRNAVDDDLPKEGYKAYSGDLKKLAHVFEHARKEYRLCRNLHSIYPEFCPRQIKGKRKSIEILKDVVRALENAYKEETITSMDKCGFGERISIAKDFQAPYCKC